MEHKCFLKHCESFSFIIVIYRSLIINQAFSIVLLEWKEENNPLQTSILCLIIKTNKILYFNIYLTNIDLFTIVGVKFVMTSFLLKSIYMVVQVVLNKYILFLYIYFCLITEDLAMKVQALDFINGLKGTTRRKMATFGALRFPR